MCAATDMWTRIDGTDDTPAALERAVRIGGGGRRLQHRTVTRSHMLLLVVARLHIGVRSIVASLAPERSGALKIAAVGGGGHAAAGECADGRYARSALRRRCSTYRARWETPGHGNAVRHSATHARRPLRSSGRGAASAVGSPTFFSIISAISARIGLKTAYS